MHYDDDNPDLAKYLQMDEREKDLAIERAILRLQKRVHELLYYMDSLKKIKDTGKAGLGQRPGEMKNSALFSSDSPAKRLPPAE